MASSSSSVSLVLQKLIRMLFACFTWLIFSLQSWFSTCFGTVVVLDTGLKVRVGRQIAQGGFSYVFEATRCNNSKDTTSSFSSSASLSKQHHNGGGSSSSSSSQKYALKRIQCPDSETLQSCKREAAVHRAVGIDHHPSLMPLLGMAIVSEHGSGGGGSSSVCYMLFPYFPHSLRQEVNQRTFDQYQTSMATAPTQAPWNQVQALKLFLGICHGVQAMHDANYTHRDIKLENVLLVPLSHSHHPLDFPFRPVLMDFGSVGPMTEEIRTRRQVMQMVDQAAQHTTMSYRPPELFEGGVRAVAAAADNDKAAASAADCLDFRPVDVWSLGCTLFAILFGASPAESEFQFKSGMLKIVDCSHLKVLAEQPPHPPPHTPSAEWYDPSIFTLLSEMLRQDRHKRPTLPSVMEQLQTMIVQLGGRLDPDVTTSGGGGFGSFTDAIDDDDDDGIALVSNQHRYV